MMEAIVLRNVVLTRATWHRIPEGSTSNILVCQQDHCNSTVIFEGRNKGKQGNAQVPMAYAKSELNEKLIQQTLIMSSTVNITSQLKLHLNAIT